VTDETKPDPAAVIANLETLTHRLRILFRAPAKAGHDDPVTLQARYTAALVTIAKFLEHYGVGKDIANRITELAAAISGLERGIVTDPVRPAMGGGRSSDGLAAWLLRGFAHAADEMEILS
jgi:hypothetical protein